MTFISAFSQYHRVFSLPCMMCLEAIYYLPFREPLKNIRTRGASGEFHFTTRRL